MTEKTLEVKLKKGVEAMGGKALKFWPVSFIGMPDRLILMAGGRAYFAEVKTAGQKVKQHQKMTHEVLRRLGFQVFIIDGLCALNSCLEAIQ